MQVLGRALITPLDAGRSRLVWWSGIGQPIVLHAFWFRDMGSPKIVMITKPQRHAIDESSEGFVMLSKENREEVSNLSFYTWVRKALPHPRESRCITLRGRLWGTGLTLLWSGVLLRDRRHGEHALKRVEGKSRREQDSRVFTLPSTLFLQGQELEATIRFVGRITPSGYHDHVSSVLRSNPEQRVRRRPELGLAS